MKKIIPFLLLTTTTCCAFAQKINNDNNVVVATTGTSLTNTDEVFTVVTQMPEFDTTKNGLQDYIKAHSQLPTSVKRTNTTKNVFVQVVIEKNGKAVFDRVAKSPDEKLSAEAKRITENMPNWLCGKQNNKPVRVSVMFPIWFE